MFRLGRNLPIESTKTSLDDLWCDVYTKKEGASSMATDGIFTSGMKLIAQHNGKSYQYVITHAGQKSLAAQLPVSGVCHGDELFYLFPYSKMAQFNEDDSKIQKLLVELWTNFVIYGEPTPGQIHPKWKESRRGKYCAIISSDGINISEDHFKAPLHFWESAAVERDRYNYAK